MDHAHEHWRLETVRELIAWTMLAVLMLHVAGAILLRQAIRRRSAESRQQ